MTKKYNSKLSEDLLREALYQEMEEIEAPPAEKTWQHIKTGLEQEATSSASKVGFAGRRGLNWLRYGGAVAAALLVVFILNSLGVWQWEQLSFPSVREEQIDTAEEPAAMEIEEDETAPEVMLEEAEEPERVLHFYQEDDPAPPQWPEKLPGNFILDNAILLNAGDAPEYHGAVYHRAEESLLLVKSAESEEAIEEFKARLELHLEAQIRTVGDIDEYSRFEVGGQPALAWQTAGHYYALLVKAGTLTPEKLIKIAEGIL